MCFLGRKNENFHVPLPTTEAPTDTTFLHTRLHQCICQQDTYPASKTTSIGQIASPPHFTSVDKHGETDEKKILYDHSVTALFKQKTMRRSSSFSTSDHKNHGRHLNKKALILPIRTSFKAHELIHIYKFSIIPHLLKEPLDESDCIMLRKSYNSGFYSKEVFPSATRSTKSSLTTLAILLLRLMKPKHLIFTIYVYKIITTTLTNPYHTSQSSIQSRLISPRLSCKPVRVPSLPQSLLPEPAS